MATITFLGAARTVTGSQYLVEAGGERLLIDSGMFQGEKALRLRNWDDGGFDPPSIPHLILTHTHLDHIGRVPRLVKRGFAGKIHCTPPTRELAELLLLDAAHLQMEDAEYLNRKKLTKHEPALPLFDDADVEATLKLFEITPYAQERRLSDVFSFTYRNAGHLLGAASVLLKIKDGKRESTVLFSGDLGRYDMVLTQDPDPAVDADYIVMESTYGNRSHPRDVSVLDQLEGVLERTFARGGMVLIPAFAVGRAQQMLVLMAELVTTGRMRPFPIHLDSPMAIDATRIYAQYPEASRASLPQIGGRSAFHTKYVQIHKSRQESENLNKMAGPGVIVSSSGMLAGGRILHHCRVRLPKAENTLVLTGYQAVGTLGRALQDGKRIVRIHKGDVPVLAEIAELRGLSGHADPGEMARWLSGLSRPPRRIFLTHGEEEAAETLAARLERDRRWDAHVPAMGETVSL